MTQESLLDLWTPHPVNIRGEQGGFPFVEAAVGFILGLLGGGGVEQLTPFFSFIVTFHLPPSEYILSVCSKPIWNGSA